MSKPNDRDKTLKSTGAGVAWSCKKCGATGLAKGRNEANSQFSSHNCR